MHQQAGALGQIKSMSREKRNLSKRIPRMGKVVFDGNSSAVDCAVKNFSGENAILTMAGWMGLPSSFTLFVEPDSIKATCRVIQRKGSNIQVEFTDVMEGVRYRATA